MHRVLLALLLALACAGPPAAPADGRSHAWGYLQLVPREGVEAPGHGGASYGDRRMRDVEFVDYSSPGFAVVYVTAPSPPSDQLRLSVRSSRVGTRLEPAHSVVGAGGSLVVENASSAPHLLSYPAANLLVRLAPGERREVPVPSAGEQDLFLLDEPDARSTVFASPGPYTVVSSTGRFALRDLEPGAQDLRVWHPRFPPVVRPVVLEPGATLRVDLQLGVGVRLGGAHAP